MAKNSILDYDTTPDNNTDMGGIGIQGSSPVNNFDNAFRTLMSQIADFTGGSTIASGTTTDLSTVKGQYVSVTGTSTITSFGTAKAGWMKFLRFTGAATITYNATSLVLPGAASITTSPGDYALFVSEGSGNWRCLEYSRASGFVPLVSGYISPGFNLANNATDATNDIDFPAGTVAAENGSILMTHAAATAQLDVAYGTGNGGRFDSAISDGTWHCFIISNGTTVSRGFSKSLNPTTAPNYPSGYTYYRRVASWPRISSALALLTHRGDTFDYVTPVIDRNSTAIQSSTLLTLSVPSGIVVQPKLAVTQQQNVAGNIQTRLASAGESTLAMMVTTAASETGTMFVSGGFYTNTSSQLQFEVQSFGGSLNLNVLSTKGWIDTRGRA